MTSDCHCKKRRIMGFLIFYLFVILIDSCFHRCLDGTEQGLTGQYYGRLLFCPSIVYSKMRYYSL